MFGLKTPPRKPARSEAEKPFWISFSDLMTALMVLFLVSMSVALMSVTQEYVSGPDAHEKKKNACLNEVSKMTSKEFPDVKINGNSISFGTLAQFGVSQHWLDKESQKNLRKYVPRVLSLARSPKCAPVFKRVIVEGFASASGRYLYNLNLSLQRAERLLCILLDPKASHALDERDRRDVRNLFLVAGSSFNALKPTGAESRRIELKLEFLDYKEKPEKIREAKLDKEHICPLN
ncbi:MAG: hypothetical protein HQL69_21240 [Magnetococcales bacterium]|nr:hypothetical protein [Magnetococcales bacterium]